MKATQENVQTVAPQRAKNHLGVIHSDVCGPFDVSSLGGNKYFLTFVDEFTRKIWLYLLKKKKEVFSLFVKWCTCVERQFEWKLNILRIDGRLEFNSKHFHEYCVAKGIEYEIRAPYTPQHDGLAKRRNKTLLDMTRCMLKEKGLPYCFWVK